MSSAQLLSANCRILRDILKQPVPRMLQTAAPSLVAALPVLRELVDGVDDLNDRVTLLEQADRRRVAATLR